jgi:DNA-cytosine methyltransferase
MAYDRTHASLFSGVGGLDLGLERAGWRTVSFSEIDPYASAVLAQRWPLVPQLGDITELAGGGTSGRGGRQLRQHAVDDDWNRATLWSGGFPCQDLSVAGKRRGLVGERSGLAFAFLALVERHRPPAVLLENVPGLLSSNVGRDFGTLLGTLGELGYGWAYRVLDARHFGVPQRRRRVFILALHAGVDPSGTGAAEVLSVGTRCDRHLAAGVEAGPGIADGADGGADIVGSVPAGVHGFPSSIQEFKQGFYRVSPSPDPRRDGAADGLARRVDDRGGVAATLNSGGNNGGFRTEPGEHLVAVYAKRHRAASVDDAETWDESDVAPTLNDFDTGDTRAVALAVGTSSVTDDTLLPNGLDSHRYRCCGNGVVSSVSEYIGLRLAAWLP